MEHTKYKGKIKVISSQEIDPATILQIEHFLNTETAQQIFAKHKIGLRFHLEESAIDYTADPKDQPKSNSIY